MNGWSAPPRMEDMAAIAKVAADEPMETRLSLEGLRRELGAAVSEDPERVANFALLMSRGYRATERQVNHALLLLAQRQDVVEILTARVQTLEARLMKVEGRQQRPWWRWWW
jgi:hypothetical protein